MYYLSINQLINKLFNVIYERSILKRLHYYFEHFSFTEWLVVAVDALVCEIVDNLHAVRSDLSEDGVRAVEPWGRGCVDEEELAPVGIASGVGHRECSGDILEIGVEFVLEFASVDTLPSPPSPGRISSLDHKVLNDAVEDNPVVVPLLGETDKIGAGFRSLFWE